MVVVECFLLLTNSYKLVRIVVKLYMYFIERIWNDDQMSLTVNSSSKISICCKSLIRMKTSRQILTIKFSVQSFRPTVRYLLDYFINVRLQLGKMQPKI